MRTALLVVCLAIVSCTGCEKRIHEAMDHRRTVSPLATLDGAAARHQG